MNRYKHSPEAFAFSHNVVCQICINVSCPFIALLSDQVSQLPLVIICKVALPLSFIKSLHLHRSQIVEWLYMHSAASSDVVAAEKQLLLVIICKVALLLPIVKPLHLHRSRQKLFSRV